MPAKLDLYSNDKMVLRVKDLPITGELSDTSSVKKGRKSFKSKLMNSFGSKISVGLGKLIEMKAQKTS